MSIEYDSTRRTWTVRWRERNAVTGETTARKKRGFATKREARRFEDEMEGLNASASFSQIADRYLESLKGYANDNTRASKRKLLEKYAGDLLAKNVREIKNRDMLTFREKLAGEDLSVGTKNRVMQIVKAVARFGSDFYELPDFSKTLKAFPKKADDVAPIRVISPEEFRQTMEHVTNEVYRRFYVFLYHTGCRRGEALALTKDEINGRQVSFNKSLRRTNTGRTPLKTTASRRTITLDDEAFEAIRPLLDEGGIYVFGDHEVLSTTTVQRLFDKALQDAGLPHYRIHDLRHSFITNAITNGADIVTVSRYVGHSNIDQTLNTYSHLLKDSENRLIGILNRVL